MFIDYSEVETALRGISSIGEAFAGKKHVADHGRRIRAMLMKRFQERSDALGSELGSGIAHVYEWDSETGEPIVSPNGRLWYSVPGDAGTGPDQNIQYQFRSSTLTVAYSEHEADPGRRATHVWANKAQDLEYRSVFNIQAGNPSPETRVSPGVSRFLLIYDQNGKPMFRERWKNYYPYAGNFRAHFNLFWGNSAIAIVEPETNRKLESQWRPTVERELNAAIKKSRKVPSGLGVHAGTVVSRVNGRPFMGRFRTQPIDRLTKRSKAAMKGLWAI